jgi:hypothetical protein
MNVSHQTYESRWADYRRRRRILWMVPTTLLLLSWGIRSFSANVPLALFISAIAAYLVLLNWSERWPCPRCGERFHAKNGTGAECAHCGLPKWTPSSSPGPGLQ